MKRDFKMLLRWPSRLPNQPPARSRLKLSPWCIFKGLHERTCNVQCFINEYVFCHTDDEIQQANDLRDLLVAALEAGTQLPVLWVLTVAAYFPLFSLPLSARTQSD